MPKSHSLEQSLIPVQHNTFLSTTHLGSGVPSHFPQAGRKAINHQETDLSLKWSFVLVTECVFAATGPWMGTWKPHQASIRWEHNRGQYVYLRHPSIPRTDSPKPQHELLLLSSSSLASSPSSCLSPIEEGRTQKDLGPCTTTTSARVTGYSPEIGLLQLVMSIHHLCYMAQFHHWFCQMGFSFPAQDSGKCILLRLAHPTTMN